MRAHACARTHMHTRTMSHTHTQTSTRAPAQTLLRWHRRASKKHTHAQAALHVARARQNCTAELRLDTCIRSHAPVHTTHACRGSFLHATLKCPTAAKSRTAFVWQLSTLLQQPSLANDFEGSRGMMQRLARHKLRLTLSAVKQVELQGQITYHPSMIQQGIFFAEGSFLVLLRHVCLHRLQP